MKFGAASLVDLPKLHLDWYRFTMEGGSKPEFLQKQVGDGNNGPPSEAISNASKWPATIVAFGWANSGHSPCGGC